MQTYKGDTEEDNKDAKSKRPRINLACFRCRRRRERCSGDNPCKNCQVAQAECDFPEARRPKRTKLQMMQDKAAALERGEEVTSRPKASTSKQPSVKTPTASEVQTDTQLNPILTPPMSTFANSANFQTPWTLTNAFDSISPQSVYDAALPWADLLPQNPWPLNGNGFDASLTSSTFPQPMPLWDAGELDPDKLIKALEPQVAYLKQDEKEGLELFYYRVSGSTAINPGLNKISFKLAPRDTTSPSVAVPSPHQSETSQQEKLARMIEPALNSQLQDFPALPDPTDLTKDFDEHGMPFPHIYDPLLNIFFRTMSQHFPSLHRRRTRERLETGTMSAFNLCCICALAARFVPDTFNTDLCGPFCSKAQELLMPLVHLPTYDAVTGLLFLSWAIYGQDSESGMWQFSGMAFRMCEHLGLADISANVYESPAHEMRTRQLFWSLFITDRILSFAHGRPTTLREDLITIPLLTDEDFYPLPSATDEEAAIIGPVEPIPFVQLVKLFVICGRISDALNARQDREGSISQRRPADANVLRNLQTELVEFYGNIPARLQWSADNLKHYEQKNLGGSYLTLHVWANAVLSFLYHPGLMIERSGIRTPVSKSIARDIKLSLASSRIINDCLVLADLFAVESLTSSPQVVQPIFVAGLAFIHEMKANQIGLSLSTASGTDNLPAPAMASSTDAFFKLLARQDLFTLMKALNRLEQKWAGASYARKALEQRASGLDLQAVAPAGTNGKSTFISLPDKGLLKRYIDQALPYSTNAPTDKTMETVAQEEMKAKTFSLEELFNSYAIQQTSIDPINPLDLAWLSAQN